jgi:polysaccharide pyruvyl transferase WcaK-like protein
MRIAVIGPLDIENYGDHLIKEVLVHRIHDAIPKARIDIFAIHDGNAGFDHGQKIFGIDSLESRHKQYSYDALIVVGGSVVHFETLIQKVWNKPEPYPMWKLWTEASRIAAKYGIKLLWNNPEAPIKFEGWQIPVARKLVHAVDFLSVRDPASRQNLEAIQESRVLMSPDSAWSLRDVYTDDDVKKSLPPELAHTDRLAVFHCNHRLAGKNASDIIETLTELKDEGFTVVLMPLAYTNSEEETMRQLNKTVGERFLLIDRKLSLIEMIAVFAHCDLYIGLSFHGAITTACYGGEVIAYDYENRRKTKELYDLIGKSSNYTTSINGLKKAIDRHLKQVESAHKAYQKDVMKLRHDSHAYFDTFISALTSIRKKNSEDLSEEYEIAVVETTKHFETARYIQDLSDNYARCYAMYKELYDTQDKVRDSPSA